MLIALIITAFSLLGLAGLQIAALRSQKIAHTRAIASSHSQNLAERVRSNIYGAHQGNYNPVLQNYPPLHVGMLEAPVCNNSFSCTPAEIAAIDIYEWRIALRSAMAGGWGEISGSVGNGYIISVYFKEPAMKTNADASEQESLTRKNQCRIAALNPTTDQDVRCFTTFFVP